jgi:hypothetical protein
MAMPTQENENVEVIVVPVTKDRAISAFALKDQRHLCPIAT